MDDDLFRSKKNVSTSGLLLGGGGGVKNLVPVLAGPPEILSDKV